MTSAPRRPAIYSANGMVAAPHHLAAFAGARVLHQGGNAVDAAVAASAVLTVVYPHMCTIGGDALWLIYRGTDRQVVALNGAGRSPHRATTKWFAGHGYTEMPHHGALPVTVPGVVDTWNDALERFGTRPLAELLDPAISYATDGIAVADGLAQAIHESTDLLTKDRAASDIFLPNGRPLRSGEMLRQPHLAQTIARIAANGRDEFYRGATGTSLVELVEQGGGLLDMSDLSSHRSDWTDPVGSTYRGWRLLEFPPPTQGVLLLELMNIVEGFDVASYPLGSAQLVHTFVEAWKLASSDRDAHLADPEFSPIPIQRLTSKDYADDLRSRIRLDRSTPVSSVAARPSDTAYVCVVDRWGTAVSLLQSIYTLFGSGLMDHRTGVLLQNRGACFSLTLGHPNCIEPRKRTFTTLMPAMALQDDKLRMVFGTAGGAVQPTTQAQILSNVIDFGLGIQEAIDGPRWAYGGMTYDEVSDALTVEALDLLEAERLTRMGHEVVTVPLWSQGLGHVQGVLIGAGGGSLEGGADPRADGAAIGC